MIENKKTTQRHWNRHQILDAVGPNATADDVLTYLLGDFDGCGSDDYVVYKYDSDGKTLFHRFNLIWVWPIFLVLAPFTWLLTGKTGVNYNSKIGRAVNWLVKLY